MQFYKQQLKRSPTAIDYLKGRGVTGEIAARFGLGFAPEGWTPLSEAFDDYLDEDLVECGLVIRKDDGRRHDRFRERIMFPIRNPRGQVIGFGGRVLATGEPKYLNSPETPLFQKGRELYGLFEARESIRETGRALVVEGYMDVIALAAAGISDAVAPLGTALTERQIEMLWRLVESPILCFDGDAAGQRAAMRWQLLESRLRLAHDDIAGADAALGRSREAVTDAQDADAIDRARWLVQEAAIREQAGDPARALPLLQQAEALYRGRWTGIPTALAEVRAAIDRLQRGRSAQP